MTDETDLRSVTPGQLGPARDLAHRAVQHLTRAARANLAPQPDDSHSNLDWLQNRSAFVSQPMTTPEGAVRVGLSIADLGLFLLSGDDEEGVCRLDGLGDDEVSARLDACLTAKGLKAAAGIALPYDLPPSVAEIGSYATAPLGASFGALAAWYGLAAETLSGVAGKYRDVRPGPSPVRCWPHHFDIATYLSLEEGDFEVARGIGIGMSPGDESYGEPYFYVNPWPHLDAASVPPAPAPGHWHTEGFVGAIATATELLTLADTQPGLTGFLENAVAAGRKGLGA